ncbi:TIGR02302 family protein [uncultured Roseovarius sp.]|uniref:TIGR02302 family protein n=1 Tax=uncultured Roseovarius sp. TaxID=293344 RepID=UPI00263505BB|nr:TIGR02302 family protein [uncultured Roseovarius sp.]
MARQNSPLTPVLHRLRKPLTLTWAGLIAERVVRAFWPLWTLVATLAAALMMGLHEVFSFEILWSVMVLAVLALITAAVHGIRRFRWPRRAEAVARIDAALPGHPLAALADEQAIGSGDPASEALWQAHQKRMADRAAQAKAVEPDLKLSRRDPFGLRYVALLGLVVALLFGSIWRVGSVGQLGPGTSAALASGPAWEGWVEPPTYTGLPSLYLNDIDTRITAPEGSRITIRLYGEVGALTVSETVSQRTDGLGAATDPSQSFEILQDGELAIDGPGGRSWKVSAVRDVPPRIELMPEGARTNFDGQMNQPFRAIDDHGVVSGTARFTLDLTQVARDYGLRIDPEQRDPIVLDLPMPIAGDRAIFSETLIENLSDHPWAHLPVTMQMEVVDAKDQTGQSEIIQLDLPARRFFDPLAAALIEQRRDILWSKGNGPRVVQILKAISYAPEPGLFRKESSYLKMRVILRDLDKMVGNASLTDEARDGIALALWDLAVLLEDGDIDDALERMRAAQERLNEAMKNGATDEEIARLMQEMRDATQDYLRQKSQQAQRENNTDQRGQTPQDMMEMSQQDLQDMMDRIQELMEQGRFAEAQQALEEFQEMMENMQVTEGGSGSSPGQEAMEGLADTLRQQQGLSDQAFRDLQEQFNPGAQAGESEGNEGRNGGQGQGQSHEGQNGQGEGMGTQQGQNGAPGEGHPGSLAERQEALRRELERQRGNLPGMGGEAGEAARESLERADDAMRGAENALRGQDLAEAIDRQSEAMEALRDGMRNMGEALAEQQSQPGQGEAFSQLGQQGSDPLGREPGQGGNGNTADNLLQGEDVYRRARELLDEIRRRSGDGERPDIELDYLKRLLDRF